MCLDESAKTGTDVHANSDDGDDTSYCDDFDDSLSDSSFDSVPAAPVQHEVQFVSLCMILAACILNICFVNNLNCLIWLPQTKMTVNKYFALVVSVCGD